jgi:hypothetical protein
METKHKQKIKPVRPSEAYVGMRVRALQSLNLPHVGATIERVDDIVKPLYRGEIRMVLLKYDDGCGNWHTLWSDCNSDEVIHPPT